MRYPDPRVLLCLFFLAFLSPPIGAEDSLPGILWGPFSLHPRMVIAEGYESNAFRVPVTPYGDLYTRLNPALVGEVRGGRLSLVLEGNYELYRYAALEDPSTRTLNRATKYTEGKGSLEFPTRLSLELRGFYKDTLDPLYGEYTLERTLLRRNRIEAEAGVAQLLFYEELKSELRYGFYRDLFPESQSAASRTIHGILTTHTYRPIPTAGFFFQLGYQRIVKETPSLFSQDFSSLGDFTSLALGFSGSFSPFYRLVARLGSGAVQYRDEPLLIVPDLSLEFFYLPNAFTELGVLGKYTFQDSVYTNYFRVAQGGVRWKQRLGRVFTLANSFHLWITRYSEPFARTDRMALFQSFLTWEPLALREVLLQLGYEGSRRNSEDPRARFLNHLAHLDLTLRY